MNSAEGTGELENHEGETTTMTAKNNCTVLVSSFDGFADCWDYFDYSVGKYWPDCPWPIVMLTGTKQKEYRHITLCPLGKDRGWADNMIAALQKVETEYVLYLQEDYWLSRPVDTSRLVEWLDVMRQRNWQYLRLNPCPPPDRILPELPEVGECSCDNKYRVSLQAAFWNKKFLAGLLYPGEDGWDFEGQSKDRLKASAGTCFCLSAPFDSPDFSGIGYCNGTAVRRGQWTRGAVAYARKEGLELPSGRTRELWLEEYLGSVSRPLPAKAMARTGLRLLQVFKGQRNWRDFFV